MSSSSEGYTSEEDWTWKRPDDCKRSPFTHVVPGNTPYLENLYNGFSIGMKSKRKEGYPINTLHAVAQMRTCRRSDELMTINGYNLAKRARNTLHAQHVVKEIILKAAETKTDLVMEFIRDWYDLVLPGELPPLHQACDRGDLEAVKKYANKDNVNEEDGMNHYPIHRAAATNNVEIMEVLKSHGVNVHARDRENRTALHWAASASAIHTIRWLFKEGVDPAIQDYQNHHFLHALVALAVTEVACTACIEFQDKLRPLANKNTNGHNLPLYLVMHREDQDVELTRVMVHYLGADVHWKNYYGLEAIHLACENPCIPRIEFLLRFGANLFSTTETLRNPFHYHIGTDRACVEMIEYLYSLGLTGDKAKTEDGYSPLQILVENAPKNLDAIEFLLKRGADINQRTKLIRRPILQLLDFRRFPIDTAALLIKYGADIRIKMRDKSEIMHDICSRKKLDMKAVYFLLQNGAKINITTRNGFQPFHYVCMYGTAAQALLFIALGSDPNFKTAEKKSPYDFALKKKNNAVVDILDKLRDKSSEKERKQSVLEVAEGIPDMPKDIKDIIFCLDPVMMKETYSGKEPHEIAVEVGASQNVIDVLKAHGGPEPPDTSYDPFAEISDDSDELEM